MRWAIMFGISVVSLVIFVCAAIYTTRKIKQKADEVYRRSMNLLMTMDDIDGDLAELRSQINHLSDTLEEISDDIYDEEFDCEDIDDGEV